MINYEYYAIYYHEAKWIPVSMNSKIVLDHFINLEIPQEDNTMVSCSILEEIYRVRWNKNGTISMCNTNQNKPSIYRIVDVNVKPAKRK